MTLHRLIDRALTPLVEPMGLTHATEGYVTVDRTDLDALVTQHGDPQAVLAGLGPQAASPALMVAEPSLCSAVLGRIWRSTRNEGAPLTQVEGEILRQFLARVVDHWRQAWAAEDMRMLPEFSMASSLSMLRPQLADGAWHVARTVVRSDDGAPIGVLLFCYPAAVLPQLQREAERTTWRARIARGLTEGERSALQARLGGPLRDVLVTAPITVRQLLTLGTLDSLERGDVLAFDTAPDGSLNLAVLDRELPGRLAQHEGRLAVAITGPEPAGHAEMAVPEPEPMGAVGGGEFDDPPEHELWAS